MADFAKEAVGAMRLKKPIGAGDSRAVVYAVCGIYQAVIIQTWLRREKTHSVFPDNFLFLEAELSMGVGDMIKVREKTL